MMTGKTSQRRQTFVSDCWAAMEPGHDDREDQIVLGSVQLAATAAMEPGHDDREDRSTQS